MRAPSVSNVEWPKVNVAVEAVELEKSVERAAGPPGATGVGRAVLHAARRRIKAEAAGRA